MIQIKDSNVLRVSGLPTDYAKAVTDKLSLDNPDYIRKIKMKTPMWGTQRYIKYYEADNQDILTPVGFRDALLGLLNKYNLQYQINADKNKQERTTEIESTITLREYQFYLLAEMLNADRGIIHLSTGGGKTILALQYIYATTGKATIIVKDKNLLHQFAAECEKFLSVTPSLIGDGKKEIGDITIATIQTLQSDKALLTKLAAQTSTLIIDECQTMITAKRRAVLNTFNAQSMFGMTATPFTSKDNMQTPAVGFCFGEIVASHEIEAMKPTVRVYATDAKIPVLPQYNKMIDKMVEHEERNKLILGVAMGEALSGSKVLILTKRVLHAQLLYDAIKTIGDVYFIQSSTKDRKTILAEMKSYDRPFKCIIGTMQLLGTGFDLPSLDRLILVGDMKSDVLTVQTTGRILRLLEGKNPIIYDMCDEKNGILKNQYMQRKKLYKEKNWKLEYHPPYMSKWL